MALRLQMTSRQRQSLGERATKEFGRNGGTIGRSLESDWVLPDGQRYISSRHASIDYRSGSYYIVDTSTNGVYVNDSETPVGRGNPQRLFSGDRIRLGEYEMSVEIDEDENTGDLADSDHVDPVSRAQRVDPPDPTSADLVQAHEITAVGIEMLISEETEAEALQQAAKLSAASLRLEADPPSTEARPNTLKLSRADAPPSAVARSAQAAAAQAGREAEHDGRRQLAREHGNRSADQTAVAAARACSDDRTRRFLPRRGAAGSETRREADGARAARARSVDARGHRRAP